MDVVDLDVAGQVVGEPCRDAVHDVDLCLLCGRELAAHEACVAGRHAVELRLMARKKLAPTGWPNAPSGTLPEPQSGRADVTGA